MRRNWQLSGKKACCCVCEKGIKKNPGIPVPEEKLATTKLASAVAEGGIENIQAGIPCLADINGYGGAAEHGTSD